MKNILRIFKYDLKKIHKNVIAMIVIMGIHCYSDSLRVVQYRCKLGSIRKYRKLKSCCSKL